MSQLVRCDECGCTLLSHGGSDPKPVGRESCPICDGTEFHVVEQ